MSFRSSSSQVWWYPSSRKYRDLVKEVAKSYGPRVARKCGIQPDGASGIDIFEEIDRADGWRPASDKTGRYHISRVAQRRNHK